MRDAPATVGGVSSQALPFRLPVFLAMVWVLALFVGVAYSGTGTQQQRSVPPKKIATPEEEFKAVRQMAERGDADAQYALGDMYANGQSVPKDDAQAVSWYRKAAEQ